MLTAAMSWLRAVRHDRAVFANADNFNYGMLIAYQTIS
jgi:hypothetical protein